MKTSEPKPEEYKLIPMFEITDKARKLAVAWMECEDKHWIGQKHKLASDIMNYAESFHKEKLREELILFASQRNEQHFLDWESKYMISVNEINDFLNTKE